MIEAKRRGPIVVFKQHRTPRNDGESACRFFPIMPCIGGQKTALFTPPRTPTTSGRSPVWGDTKGLTLKQQSSRNSYSPSSCFLIAATWVLIVPVPLTFTFQLFPTATPSYGSIYFWSLLSVWMALILLETLDGQPRSTDGPTTSGQEAFYEPSRPGHQQFAIKLMFWGPTSTFHCFPARERCSRLASEHEPTPWNATTHSPVMTPEPNSADIVPAAADAKAPGERVGAITRVALLVLLPSLLCWNLLLLAALFHSLPKNDFGRPFWSTLTFFRGEDMYALNESVLYLYKETTYLHLWDLNPPHAHLVLLPLANLPPRLTLLAWCILGGLCLFASIRIILTQLVLKLTPSQCEWMMLGILSFTGMGTAVITGHMSFPLMLLVTLAWLDARNGRWWRAGAWLGLGMSIKPFLLFFIPYFLLKGRWRGPGGLCDWRPDALSCWAGGSWPGESPLLAVGTFSGRFLVLASHERIAVRGHVPRPLEEHRVQTDGGARSSAGTCSLARPGDPGGRCGVASELHRFVRAELRPCVRYSPG